MATFLTTSKMNSALAARVDAAVHGRRVATRRSPGLVAASRLGAVVLVTALVAAIAVKWQQRDAQQDASRADLIAAIADGRDSLSSRERQLVGRASALLREAVEAPDVTPNDVALDELLAQPTVYVRGKRDAFSDPARTTDAIRDSVKDTFVLCLQDPPEADTEKALLDRVHVAYTGGLEGRTKNVSRLQDAVVGLPFLTRAFMKEVEDASSLEDISKLRDRFYRAPLKRAKAAAKAELLVYVLDDPPAQDAVAELDGSSKHEVRVGLVHIPSGKPYLRKRAHVDPAWISDEHRAELGRGLTGCRLALDVRALTSPKR